MKVSIIKPESKISLPVPLFMGTILIRCIPKKYINSNEKKIILKLYKSLKSSLKNYKGLELVEIVSHNGEHITIKI